MLNCLVVFYFIRIFVTNAVADIAVDYYYGNDENIRTTNEFGTCLNEKVINSCYAKCGPRHACLLGQCFCIIVPSVPKIKYKTVLLEESDEDVSDSYEDYDDSSEILTEPNTNEYIDDDSMEHPILRHHIAHFCPNLDLARVCIRKCMNVGKPAFCGKDHVCYCGHKYEVPGAVSNLTAADTHNQFRDLYEKYFGPKKQPHHGKHSHT